MLKFEARAICDLTHGGHERADGIRLADDGDISEVDGKYLQTFIAGRKYKRDLILACCRRQ